MKRTVWWKYKDVIRAGRVKRRDIIAMIARRQGVSSEMARRLYNDASPEARETYRAQATADNGLKPVAKPASVAPQGPLPRGATLLPGYQPPRREGWKPLPKEYDDPNAQLAYEYAYIGRWHLLDLPLKTDRPRVLKRG